MSVADRAVEWALRIARDDSHGYDQGTRWGPDYDCSSLIISAYKQAGVPLTCTYTGDMKRDMIMHGFVEIPFSVGLRPGDVLLNEAHHTAMYIGNGQIVHAAGNEHGGAAGGLSGDQTGREICIAPYYVPSYGWDCALRYTADQVPIHPNPVQPPAESSTGPHTDSYRPGDRYMVQPNDTLWGIAERFLGDGNRWHDLYAYNNLKTIDIYPGDVIELPAKDWTPKDPAKDEKPADPQPAPEPDPKPNEKPKPTPDADLPVLGRGDQGYPVEVLQMLLMYAGYELPVYGMDGDFGSETEKALLAFQGDHYGIEESGTTDPTTWAALIWG